MSHSNIRQIPRSCVSYHPGHQLHWIHAKKAHEPRPEITVVTIHDDRRVELDGDDLHPSLAPRSRTATVGSLTRQDTTACGSHGSMRCSHRGGRIFNLAALDH